VVVLRESPHLGRDLHGVVAQHVADQQRVGYAVRDVVVRAEFVRHRVAHAEERVGESHPRHSRGVGHLLASGGISRALVVCDGQPLENHFKGLYRQTVGVVRRHDRGVGFQAVGNRVYA